MAVTRVFVRQAFPPDTLPQQAIDLYAQLGRYLIPFETVDCRNSA